MIVSYSLTYLFGEPSGILSEFGWAKIPNLWVWLTIPTFGQVAMVSGQWLDITRYEEGTVDMASDLLMAKLGTKW